MINTYNETSLHKKIKEIYATQFNGKTEQKINNYIYDVITEDNSIIEIQTSNISALKKKIEFCIKNDFKIKIVHPIIEEKYIELYNKEGILISRRKSPKKENIYSILRKLTGIYNFLLNQNFTLEVIFVSIVEKRLQTKEKSQLKNKSRKYLKNWIPIDKLLISVNSKRTLQSYYDYKTLLPLALKSPFTSQQLKKELQKEVNKTTGNTYRILIWMLKKLEIISDIGKQGRNKLYQIN